ncbi:poly [ADP-ribose] polymerase 2-A [Typha angustifolia]|uniref:poly [ADP-ribose] polymerase 2-A n=1 Tax=Typha angustifolia TaxID=59011 RepID=UPI003C2EA006
MSSKLKVDELRAELSLRGLDTNGTKPTLVRRLDSAIRKENKKKQEQEEEEENASSSAAANAGKKRPRDEAEDGGGDVEKLQDMGIRELRELAKARGLPANGSKNDLVIRLSEVDLADGGEVEEPKKEKLVRARKKGGAVLDQHVPDHIKSSYHVLQVGEEIYDATLNQTNVGDNNNKFYVMQALESDDDRMFMVYNRWGRVGIRGQDKLHGPFGSRERAVDEFQKKFFDKTKNQWADRKKFICYPKCYTWLEMDYSEAEKEAVADRRKEPISAQPRETKLDPRIANFVSLVCNISMMKQQMMEIGYNAEKLPLGKLSKSTILKGYDVLRRISDVILKPDRKRLEQLSGEFYTVIPHDFGFKKMCAFVIDTPQKLKRKLDMVQALGEIEVATKLLEGDADMQDDPLYSRYQQLQCELAPVEVDSEEFSMIKKYMLNTHGKTHSSYAVEIIQIFKVSRHGELERFKKFSDTKNRMLLWHGSRLTNWTGILSQGLRIAPPEAPVTGYMFGKGVYFADMFSKSANYCCASQSSRSGVLLLCEVALGDMNELQTADYNADQLPKGKLSTKGVGATEPDMSQSEALEDGVVVPLGESKEQKDRKGCLLYNEYIVYNVDQIKMRYVIHVDFNFKR